MDGKILRPLRRVYDALFRLVSGELGLLWLVALFSLNMVLYYYGALAISPEIAAQSGLFLAVKCVLHFLAGLTLLIPVALLLRYLPRRLGALVRGLLAIGYGVVFICDCFLYVTFGSFLDQAKLETVVSADPLTVREFLMLYVDGSELLLVALLALLVLGGRRIWQRMRVSTRSSLARAMTVMLIAGVVSFALFGTKTAVKGILISESQISLASVLEDVRLTLTYTNSPLGRAITDTIAAVKNFGSTSDIYAQWDAHEEAATGGDVPYVVVIMGESTDRNKMSAYGYGLDTTPNIRGMLDAGEAVAFTDTIACANGTAKALSLIFSFAEKDSPEEWYNYYNVIDVFNKAGYHTAWISNQSPSGRYGNMDGIYSGRASERTFVSVDGGSLQEIAHYDELLLPLLDESLAHNTSARSLYVVHLVGAHEPYKSRYPSNWARFSAADEPAGEPAKWSEAKAEYDNAIYYTDHMVSEIVERFRDKNAVVIFISDHGSEVYDGRDFMGHSMEDRRNPHMIEIPFIVWGSDSFWRAHARLKNELAAATARPYSTENIAHFLLDIAGIKSTSYDPQKSILTPDNIYKTKPRLYGGEAYKRGNHDK